MIYAATEHMSHSYWLLGIFDTEQKAIDCAKSYMLPLDEHERGYVFMVHAWHFEQQQLSGHLLPCDDCYMREHEGEKGYPFDFPIPADTSCGLVWRETDNLQPSEYSR